MSTYLISITIVGIAVLGMAWMPELTKKIKISYAIAYVLVGMMVYSFIPNLPMPDPIKEREITLHLSELVVIVSIMGTGLKIDEPFSFKVWKIPFRLVTLTMLLCIGSVAFVTWYFLKVSPAVALLLGAVLAPTDPVLASDVQVGPPQRNDQHNVRFSLTAEAGMNDGMAFPFTWLAITIALIAGGEQNSYVEWVWFEVLYKITTGVLIGFLMGKLLAYLVIYLPEKKNFVVIKDGFVGIAATLLVYGVTEMLKGYGFIAVFVTAIALRNSKMDHKYHKKLHSFTDEIERILMAIFLILFGGALVSGILKPLTLNWAIFGMFFLFFIRPVSGLISLIGAPIHVKEKLAVSFFGIRGMGSFFYLAFALGEATFERPEQLWAIISFIVLLSIVVHGLSAPTVMNWLIGKFPHVETLEKEEKEKDENK